MIWRLLQKQEQFLHHLTRHRSETYSKIRSPAWERIFFEFWITFFVVVVLVSVIRLNLF
jgi:hypothetical protein